LYSKKISIDFDAALFRDDSSRNVWELFYAIPDTSFTYVYDSGVFTGCMKFTIKISGSDGMSSESDWIVKYSTAEKITSLRQILLGEKKFEINPGNYNAEIKIIDLNDNQTFAVQSFAFQIRDLSKSKIMFSDILLSRQIFSGEDSSVDMWDYSFLRGNYFVLPNPSLEYIGSNPELIAYFELYCNNVRDTTSLLVDYKIYDSQKFLVFRDNKQKRLSGEKNSIISTIPIGILHSGAYTLEIKALYPIETPVDSISVFKKFYVINPEKPPKESNYFSENIVFEKSEFITMGEEKVNEEINQAKLIGTIFEAQRFDELSTLVAKQRALFNFWITRDPDTTTSFNEKRIQFKSLIDYANTFFSYGKSNSGWSSERGRIMLKFGQPDQRDVFPAEDNKRAYETWIYNLQNQLTFNFVDLQGFGNFQLVNSNAFGYVRNDNWFNMYVKEINLNSDPDDFNNSLINGTRNRTR
jgi:GWxTD domain-containing protein